MIKKNRPLFNQAIIAIIVSLVIISATIIAISIRSSSEPILGKAFAGLSSSQKQLYWKCMADNGCNTLLKEAQTSKNYAAYRKCAKDCSDSALNFKQESYYCSYNDGTDFLTKSKVVSNLYTQGKEDYCYTFPNGKTYLMEGKCKNNQYAYVQKNCEELGNNYLCEDGSCVLVLKEVPLDWDISKPIYSKKVNGIFAKATTALNKEITLSNLKFELFMGQNLQYFAQAEWETNIHSSASGIIVSQESVFKLSGNKENNQLQYVSILNSPLKMQGKTSFLLNENQEYTFTIQSCYNEYFPKLDSSCINHNFILKMPKIAKAEVNCKKIVDNGLQENKLDMVFIPSEYSEEELKSGKLEKDVHLLLFEKVPDSAAVEERISFFDVPLFNQNFNLFNVHVINEKVPCCNNNQLLSSAKSCGFDQQKDVIVVMYNSVLGMSFAEGIGTGNKIYMFKGNEWQELGSVLAHEFGHLIGLHEEYYTLPSSFMTPSESPNCEYGDLTCSKWCKNIDAEKVKQVHTAKEKFDACQKILTEKDEIAWKDFCSTLDLGGIISDYVKEVGGSYSGAMSQEEYCTFPLSEVIGYTCYAGTFWPLDRDESLNLGVNCLDGYQCYFGCGGNYEWTRSTFVGIMGGGTMGETQYLWKQKEKNAGEKILPDFSPAASQALKE